MPEYYSSFGEAAGSAMAHNIRLTASRTAPTPPETTRQETTMATRCPSCTNRTKGPGKYLCLNCWSSLSLVTRRALNRRDDRAMTRLQELHRQLAAGVSLAEMTVSP